MIETNHLSASKQGGSKCRTLYQAVGPDIDLEIDNTRHNLTTRSCTSTQSITTKAN